MKQRRCLFAGLLAILALTGCSTTRTVSMNAMRPAEISFPADVQTILIVDRTEYHDGTAGLLEGLITGEVLVQDRAGLQAMIDELRDQLAYSGRFDTRVAHELLPGNSLSSVFPDPLDWTEVDALLRRYDADLALSIEIFDSDFIVTDGRRMVKRKVRENGEEKQVEVSEYFAEGVANLTIGIRLYYAAAQAIVDEQLMTRPRAWEAQASTVQNAVLALMEQADAASRVSRRVGRDYAYKIAPMPVRISRQFYSKSKRVPAMELGARHADVGHWREAVKAWEDGLANAEVKDAGRLCLNIAVAYEVLGEWENARGWAERSYVEYGNRDARGYVAELDLRVEREEIAQSQMR